MTDKKKILGENRRELILQLLKERNEPITGGELADEASVSRQVIVQDISLLKAKKVPIIATSQGYMYLQQNHQKQRFSQIVACKHTPEQTREELRLIVDHGVTVKDVFIEHPVYGDLVASIMVSNRNEVDQFLKKVEETNAPYLLQLTDGIHLHTLEADSEEKLQLAYHSLDRAGFIIQS
ncbi:HTH domain-containing protein [Aquibacillus halophilus]|uniref:HTH domain-containing protein n=1 Tax=Aquibacillus halophilus TaxID=930132 RepID=A0A6A8DCJ8_9BACI|nr:transcription repressor NadR [Aquibacillus halophilus]MRH42990.1 HTH domain-containing protein [Aquibacillus halophilus]